MHVSVQHVPSQENLEHGKDEEKDEKSKRKEMKK